MQSGISDLSVSVLTQLRKACAAAAAASGGAGGAGVGGAASKDAHDGFPDLDNFYGGDSGPSIQSLVEVSGV